MLIDSGSWSNQNTKTDANLETKPDNHQTLKRITDVVIAGPCYVAYPNGHKPQPQSPQYDESRGA